MKWLLIFGSWSIAMFVLMIVSFVQEEFALATLTMFIMFVSILVTIYEFYEFKKNKGGRQK